MKNPISKIKSALRGESASQSNETNGDAAGLERHLSTLPPEAQNASETKTDAPRQTILAAIRAAEAEVNRLEKEMIRNEQLKEQSALEMKEAVTARGSVDQRAKVAMEAKQRMDLCEIKEFPLFDNLREAKETLVKTVRKAIDLFETAVTQKRANLNAALQYAVFDVLGKWSTEFMKGGGLNTGMMPVNYYFDRAILDPVHFRHAPGNTRFEENLARVAVAHIERHAKSLEIDVDTLFIDDPIPTEKNQLESELAYHGDPEVNRVIAFTIQELKKRGLIELQS